MYTHLSVADRSLSIFLTVDQLTSAPFCRAKGPGCLDSSPLRPAIARCKENLQNCYPGDLKILGIILFWNPKNKAKMAILISFCVCFYFPDENRHKFRTCRNTNQSWLLTKCHCKKGQALRAQVPPGDDGISYQVHRISVYI